MNKTETPPDAPAPLSRRKRVLFTLIMLALVVGVLQLGAYAYLRAFRGYDGRHLMQYEFDPYKNVLPTRNFVDTRGIRHNAAGFRRTGEVAREKPPGTLRIFLMGGSTAYGLGGLWPHIEPHYAVIPNDATIDAYLERRLAAVFPEAKVEVINAAITSTWTHHSFIYLNQTILNYQPDLVLFMDGFNDFYFFEPSHDQFASYTYNLTSRVVEGPPTLRSLAGMNGWWLFRKFSLAHVAGRAGRQLKLLVNRPSQDRSPIDAPRQFAGLQEVFPRSAGRMHERMAVLLRHEGIPAVFMLQPMMIMERGRATATPIEREMFEFNVSSYRPNYEAFMRLATPWIVAQEQAMAERTGATFLDLTEAFRDTQGQVYTDYCHLTPLGNEVVAGIIERQIVPTLRSRLTAAAAR